MKKILALLLSLCCAVGLTTCNPSDELPKDYVIGVIRTSGSKNSSDILYFNEELEQTGSTHYKYATMGEIFYPPVVNEGVVYIVPQGQANKKNEKTILQLNLETLEQQQFALDQIAIYGVSVNSSAIYAANNINNKSYVSRIDRIDKSVKTIEYNNSYVSTTYVFNDVLYVFLSTGDNGALSSTLHCIDPIAMTVIKQVDLSAFGCSIRSVVGVDDILYFAISTDPQDNFNNVVGVYDTTTGEITTVDFPQDVFHLMSVGGKLYVTHGNLITGEGTSLSVYDLVIGNISTYDLGFCPGQIAADGKSLYVMGQNQLAKYDLQTMEKQTEIKISLNEGYYLSGIFARS
ncbi:MAG: hypothetical protein J6B48_08165 [Clostridia bacterium]|nr:hypothetical protein [Clostridia bacterium]